MLARAWREGRNQLEPHGFRSTRDRELGGATRGPQNELEWRDARNHNLF
jgi:hypothetical protein